MTLACVLVHILAKLSRLLTSPVFSPDDAVVLSQLQTTIAVLDDIACAVGDALAIEILDDFSYAAQHINLANWKAEAALVELQPKLESLLNIEKHESEELENKLSCSFCGAEKERQELVTAAALSICKVCLQHCSDILLDPKSQFVQHKNTRCSFCKTSQEHANKLIEGPSLFICDACVKLGTEVLSERSAI